ncbi:MAG: (Fe-S)-binding protein [Desulfarculus sp.]|nr:(Fe-S)-binding protein [Desulfarculus sp.]
MAAESWPAPAMALGASADQACLPAQANDLEALGLPEALPPDWRQRLLGAFGQALEGQRGLRQALEACVGCGACHQSCSFHLGTGDPHNTPQGRADLARRLYRRHFSPRARLLGRWGQPRDILDEDLLGLWRAYFWQCTLCRRCTLFCPLGIDTSLVTRACRHILAQVGQVPGHVAREFLGILGSGNGQGLPPAAWTARHQALEEELLRETGQAMACPVDEQGADVLLIPSPQEPFSQSATYKGYAKVFHAAGLSWTTSTYLNQASNPGLWLGPRQAALVGRRVLEATRLLKPRHIVVAESGQGWAVLRNLGAVLAGGLAGEKYLKAKEPLHICQLSSRLLKEGAFAGVLRPQALQGVKPVFHEPCQVARSGGLGQEPRRLLKAACLGWLEMPKPVGGPLTLCCGAGGGLNAPELYQVRLAGLMPLARALAQAQRRQGCTAVVTMCATCQDQLGEGLAHFGLGLTVHGVHEFLGQALYPSRPAEARP